MTVVMAKPIHQGKSSDTFSGGAIIDRLFSLARGNER